MNLDQYRAVTKTELDITDHSDADRAGDNGETIKFLVTRHRNVTARGRP